MHSIISASLLALAMFTTTSIASQVNRYSDDHCGNFKGSVFSSGWGCQTVSGASVLVAGNKGAQCNYYKDENCNQFAFTLRNPGCSATGDKKGSIACNN